MMKNKVSYIGLGYIGLPTAVLTAKSGFETFGYDIDKDKIFQISKGDISINEPFLKEELNKVLELGYLNVSTSLIESEIYVVVVPTPLVKNNKPDISIVKSSIANIIPILKEGDLIIIESTCPVLTTEKMLKYIYQERPELDSLIYMAYCPERVLPGNILYELVNNDRIVGGINEKSSDMAKLFYSNFVEGQIHITDSKTAEMCKLTENSARDTQIAFANELSIICDEADINVWELIELANKHPRVNILSPGIGVGGHCIAVDPWFLVADYPDNAKLIKHVRETNTYKTSWCLEKIFKARNEFIAKENRDPTIACMGLAYKPDVDDLRESPAVKIVRSLVSSDCKILISEPNIQYHKEFKLVSIEDALTNADIIVWLVGHNQYLNKTSNEYKIQFDFCGLKKYKI
jgi:UDP-N-acetyl-D-mannosaminuronic acid dehydrogenase